MKNSSTGRMMPKYPVYVPSKGRADSCLTARCLIADGVPFSLVIEEQERKAYAEKFPRVPLLVLPFSNQGSVIPARNWMKEHATKLGAERHWQIDDNISGFWRVYNGKRLYCDAGIGLKVCEDFTDRYENIAIAGLNYVMFYTEQGYQPPFYLNNHVYSCSLILNSLPYKWRGRYNEDTDYCLQALSEGWCTVLLNAFLVQKLGTMVMKGGNTDALSYHNDGRLKMARALERLWPGVVETKRRFKRPQHVVADSWRKFDNKLRLKPGVVIAPGVNEYGMRLERVQEVKAPKLQVLAADWDSKRSEEAAQATPRSKRKRVKASGRTGPRR